jgi:hypothetical protein
MQCEAFHPRYAVTGLVGLLILILKICTNQPVLAQLANSQFEIQKFGFLNTNSLVNKKESS